MDTFPAEILNDNSIKIVSYNVLAQRFADAHYDKVYSKSISKES